MQHHPPEVNCFALLAAPLLPRCPSSSSKRIRVRLPIIRANQLCLMPLHLVNAAPLSAHVQTKHQHRQQQPTTNANW
jgi:hypothetical protein